MHHLVKLLFCSATSSSLYYLLSLLSNDFRNTFFEIVSKACWLEASPVDTEGDCSDALACITRVVGWTQCSTERYWSSLISLMKANNLTTAAIEIEKCLKRIISKLVFNCMRCTSDCTSVFTCIIVAI